MKWLTLAMPWGKYKCARCGAIIAGTLLRLILVSLCTGVLGYVLIGVVKGKIDFWLLPLPLAVTLAVLFLDLPKQIKRVSVPAQADESDNV